VAIVDAGSLAAAARRLRRSPPAVTRALAGLEERVGVRLVERTTRRLSPTDAGRDLSEKARRLLADYDATVGNAAATGVRGVLRVAAPLVFGRRHVTPVVTSFLAAHPEVQIELVLNDRNQDLIEEELHVALRIGPLADSGLVARRLGSVRRVLVASPDYLARRGMPRTPAELRDHDIVLGAALQPGAEWRFGVRGPVLRLAPRLIVSDIEAMLWAVRDGHGIGRPLSYQAADEVAAGTLVRILRDAEPPPLPVHLVVPGGRHMTAKTRAFLDHAADRLGRLPVLHED
jgi:DNA-binding transcriptional LysR family regulator